MTDTKQSANQSQCLTPQNTEREVRGTAVPRRRKNTQDRHPETERQKREFTGPVLEKKTEWKKKKDRICWESAPAKLNHQEGTEQVESPQKGQQERNAAFGEKHEGW